MATTTIPRTTIHSRSAILTQRASRVLLYLAVIVLAIIFMFPYFWTISSSLKATGELYVYPPLLIPAVPQPQNYPHVFELFEGNFAHWLWNTVVVTFFSVIGWSPVLRSWPIPSPACAGRGGISSLCSPSPRLCFLAK